MHPLLQTRGHRRRLHATVAGLLAFLTAAGLLSIGWNLFAPELLGLGRLDPGAAAGLLLFTLLIARALRPGRHHGGSRRGRD